MDLKLVFVLGLCLFLVDSATIDCQFPPDFQFGTATSAYQIEGGWNADGKTPSIWDYASHNQLDHIKDRSTGDVACDSYHQIDIDIANLKNLNVHFYRFSLSWTRILPNGTDTVINKAGIAYYNELIDKLLKNGIEPMVTIFHWDLPQILQDLGGWANPLMIDYYVNYARVVFKYFGDRVKTWITFNEMRTTCYYGYEGGDGFLLAPFIYSPGVGPYLCIHHMLLAHGHTYKMKKDEFPNQESKMGLAIDGSWAFPATNTSSDRIAAIRVVEMSFGLVACPVYCPEGNYPDVVRERIDSYSKIQGFAKSRLPRFTEAEVKLLRGSYEFLGLNQYFGFIAKAPAMKYISQSPSMGNDIDVITTNDPKWESTGRPSFKVVPEAFRALLGFIKESYKNPVVYITENGYGGEESEDLNDDKRISYMNKYLTALLEAIKIDKCNVKKYTYWSFMDNYEWMDGYTLRFGLYHVNFTDSKRKRTPKKSVKAYSNIIKSNSVPNCRISSNAWSWW